jgi:hypothetical protein
MQIIDNKALLLRVKEPAHIMAAVDKSHLVSAHEVLVRWDVTTAQRLRAMNIKVPSPIMGQYQWTGRHKPMDHQKKTAAFLTLNRKAFCFSEAGSGKTASTIWAADFLMKRKRIRRVLVICPVSIMDVAWRADLFSFAMHRTVSIAHGTPAKRKKIIAEGAEFVIINYDGVAIVKDEIIKGGFYKNAQSHRWKVLNAILKELPDAWLWMMTGTPAAQGPEDAYGLAKLVNPKGVPRTFGAFKDMVMIKLTQFKWAPRKESSAIVHKVLQPAIRFTKEECMDLPDMVYVKRDVELTKQQKTYYERLRKNLLLETAGSVVSAVNAAVGMNKLVQISCIAYGTPVLCKRGWTPIQQVTGLDRLWDGDRWVSCTGAVFMGDKPTVALAGIELTPDHKVLTTLGWREAKDCRNGPDCEGFIRAEVRLPDGYPTSRYVEREAPNCHMAVSMRLWGGGNPSVAESTNPTSTKLETLRLQAWGAHNHPRGVEIPEVQDMDKHAQTVPRPAGQGLQELRGSRDTGMPTVGSVVCNIPARYGSRVFAEVVSGSEGQQWPVQPRELSVGHTHRTGAEHSDERDSGHSERPHDNGGGRQNIRPPDRDALRQIAPVQLVAGESATNSGTLPVYDILNCGPNSRFVVMGSGGELTIVHNCGAVYDDDGNVLEFDIGNRYSVLKEVIAEASKKVLVFVPYTHITDILAEKMRADGYSVDIIRGDVPVSRRTEIFQKFQREADPAILLIQPQAAAHGVTLTAANVVVWWGPTSSLEIYVQANARVHRSGQANKCMVVQLQGSPVEKHLYNMLDAREGNHMKLTSLYKEMLD